jgi:hypothetical protein
MISRRRLAVVGLLAAIFALGGAAGRMSLATRQPDCPTGSGERARTCQRGRFAATLDRELKLTPSQRDSVQTILRKWDPNMRAVWDGMLNKYDSLRVLVRADIRQVLTDDQKSAFQRWTAHADSVRTQKREAERVQ